MVLEITHKNDLGQFSTAELKTQLLERVADQDALPFSQKVRLYQQQLEPYFVELQRRNPYPTAEAQIPIILGVWTPLWSTIPFHDLLPGRIQQQSYQIFHDDGYYANVAHYVPGHQFGFLQRFASMLVGYNLMVVQRFEAQNGSWFIQNIGIEQALEARHQPLTIEDAEAWFTSVIQTKLKSSDPSIAHLGTPDLRNLNQKTAKKFKKTFLATPLLEHLYVDRDLRLVKTQREAHQRPSYTIAIRRR